MYGCASVLKTSARDRTRYQHLSYGKTQSEWVRTVVQVDVVGVVEGEVEVLEDLSEPKALHVVDEARVQLVDVVDRRERDRRRLEVRLEALVRGHGALVVLDVARVAPRVEVGLEHLGAHVVVLGAIENEEPVLVVEVDVALGWGRTGVVAVSREVAERLRADASAVRTTLLSRCWGRGRQGRLTEC